MVKYFKVKCHVNFSMVNFYLGKVLQLKYQMCVQCLKVINVLRIFRVLPSPWSRPKVVDQVPRTLRMHCCLGQIYMIYAPLLPVKKTQPLK